jgi:impB/mucB/samB family
MPWQRARDAYARGLHAQSRNLFVHGCELRRTVQQWTGIPVSVGIAPTKTLAKVANRFAKKATAGHSRFRWSRKRCDTGKGSTGGNRQCGGKEFDIAPALGVGMAVHGICAAHASRPLASSSVAQTTRFTAI